MARPIKRFGKTNRQCLKCKRPLSLTEFRREGRNANGFGGTCKACKNQTDRIHREERKELALHLIARNGGAECECCGSIISLQVDHIGSTGGIHKTTTGRRIKGLELYRFIINNKSCPEILSLFRVLCYKCNTAGKDHVYCKNTEGHHPEIYEHDEVIAIKAAKIFKWISKNGKISAQLNLPLMTQSVPIKESLLEMQMELYA